MNFKLNLIIVSMLLGQSTMVAAQEQAGVIKTASGIDFLPALSVSLKHDDNVIRAKSDEITSWVSAIAPSLKAIMVDGADTYSVSAALKDARYFSSRNDEFTDGYLEAEAKLSPSIRHQFKAKLNTSWLHEDRGTGVAEGRGAILDEVTRFNSQLADFEYLFGAPSSTGKIRLTARYFNKDYQNFDAITQYRSFDSALIGGAFLYQTASAFDLVAEITTAEIGYDVRDLTGSRDNQDTNVRIGTEWEFTSVTTGSLKLGYQNKQFDLGQREDFKGFAWEALLTWQPLTYSGFDIATGRRAKDVDAAGILDDFIIETTYALGWNHQWSEIWTTKLAYEHNKNEYNLNNRTDTSKVITVELSGSLTRWLTMQIFANIEDRRSTLGIIEFDRNVIGIDFQMTL